MLLALAANTPSLQFLPSTSSSLLRPGSRFKGSQTSDRQRYDVEVEIKHVDMCDSFLCGYLRIKGTVRQDPRHARHVLTPTPPQA